MFVLLWDLYLFISLLSNPNFINLPNKRFILRFMNFTWIKSNFTLFCIWLKTCNRQGTPERTLLTVTQGRKDKSHEDEQLCGGTIGDKEKQNGLCTMKWRRTGDLKVVKNTLIWVPCAAKWGHGDALACAAS